MRTELALFRDDILSWRDVFTPAPEEAHPTLGYFPYLGPYYEFRARESGDEQTLRRIFAFNFSAIVSMGPHSTSVSGHKYFGATKLYSASGMAKLVRRLRKLAKLPSTFTLDACRHGGMTELEEAELTDGQGRALSAHKSRAYEG
jgi:hypothetical protein